MKNYALFLIPSFFLLFASPVHSDVTLTVGDGSGYVGSHYNSVDVSLDNSLDNKVKQLVVEVCDQDNYLSVNEQLRCETTTRTSGFTCITLELPGGCARAILSASAPSELCDPPFIDQGTGPVITLIYDVSDGAPSSGSRALTPQNGSVLDENGDPLTVAYGPDGTFDFSACAGAGDCNDGQYCNGTESCTGGVCEHTDNPCLPETECNSCNETDNNCFDPAGTACEDGLFCTGEDTCDGAGSCTHTGDPCPSGTDCNETDDVCNCDIEDDCDDGLWCNGDEFCFLGECAHIGDPCISSPLHCDEDSATCVCLCASECDDELYCTGVESCAEGVCETTGDPCSLPEVCDEGTDQCVEPDVTVTVMDGTGPIGVPGNEVEVRLTNASDKVNGVQMVICDEGDYLTISGCDEGGRSNWGPPNPCAVNEQVDGCASVLFYNDDPGSKLPINTGSGVILTLKFDVKGPGETDTGCGPLSIESLDVSDEFSDPLTARGIPGEFCIICLFGSNCEDTIGSACSGTGDACDGDADCPTGETCEPVYNVCTDNSCVASECVYTPNTDPCDDGLFCNGTTDQCSGGECVGTGNPCGACEMCDEGLAQCDVCTDDCDCDGVLDAAPDNCVEVANGPDFGTCALNLGGVVVGTGVVCTGDGDCDITSVCQKNQEDSVPPGGNGIGDVCECYSDSNCDGKVNLSDLVTTKSEFLRNDCDDPLPCDADFNGDLKVNLSDLVIIKSEFLRNDCPPCP